MRNNHHLAEALTLVLWFNGLSLVVVLGWIGWMVWA